MDGDADQGSGGVALPRRDIPAVLLRSLLPGQPSTGARVSRVRSVVGASNRRDYTERLAGTVSDLLHKQPPQTAAAVLKRSLTPMAADHTSLSLHEFFRRSAATPNGLGSSGLKALNRSGASLTADGAGSPAKAAPSPALELATSVIAGRYVPRCDTGFRLAAADAEQQSFAERQHRTSAARSKLLTSSSAGALGSTPLLEYSYEATPQSFRAALDVVDAAGELPTPVRQFNSASGNNNSSVRARSSQASSDNVQQQSSESMWRFLRTASPLAPSIVASSSGKPPAVPPAPAPKLRQELTDYHRTFGVTQAPPNAALFVDEKARFAADTRQLGHGSRTVEEKHAQQARVESVLQRVRRNVERVASAYEGEDARRSEHRQTRKMFPQVPSKSFQE